MKQITILLLLVATLSANDSLMQKIWSTLEIRHDATVNYYREGARSFEIRKNILETGETISTSPTLQGSARGISNGDFLFGNQTSWSHPRWDGYFAFNVSDDKLENCNLQFLYTLKSDRGDRIGYMDTLISMTHLKADLQREAMVFNDFQQLLSYKVQYDYLLSEMKAREKMAIKGGEFLSKLKQFVSAGVVPRNATQSIELFLQHNRIRMDAIVLESDLTIDNVTYMFDLDGELFKAIHIDSLLAKIDLGAATKTESYTWRMDSLNAEIQRVQLHEQNMNSWKLSAGASIYVDDYSEPALYNNSLHLKFDYTFHKRDFTGYKPLRKATRKTLPNGVDEKLGAYKKLSMEHADQASKWIASTLERIQLGEVGIIHEISQNLDIILNQQIRYYYLLSTYYRRDLAQVKAMSQLPEGMRWK